MDINRPINRRKALKVLGLGMLATCFPTLPACGNAKNEKKIKRLIFYFSATGNSLYVSRQIAGEEGTLLSISQEIHNENPVYEAEEIGFVCPVYCFIPPAIVQDFIARSTLSPVPRSKPIITSRSELMEPIARSSRSSWTIWPRRTVSR